MEAFVKVVLILHIVAGSVALICGSLSMIARKGKSVHKKSGIIFFCAMVIVAASAIFLSVVKQSWFLFCVGIFVFYQTYSGLRAIRNKDLRHNFLDVLIILMAFANGIAMLISGEIVLMVFGGITFLLMFTELKVFIANRKNEPLPKLSWLTKHIGMMVGSYIGTFTAFLVVNIQFQPGWVIWLAPTVVFVPLMQYWTWKFTKKPLRRTTAS